MLLLFIVEIGAVSSSIIASTKNRNPIGWFVFGALLPLIAVICACVVQPVQALGALDAPRL